MILIRFLISHKILKPKVILSPRALLTWTYQFGVTNWIGKWMKKKHTNWIVAPLNDNVQDRTDTHLKWPGFAQKNFDLLRRVF